ncbi:hypothetical protein IFM89_021018 [Coptis chinensis]|uniref:non-specific serine/threonine protein kinase n=1 Tax=Coptis chinensis TaxID=261450 RepID=A0A835H7R3_9MAGN|nr:hypothetical protein IFM89_021018 [Coptis chinensis]
MFQLLLLLSLIVISLNKILPVSSIICPYDNANIKYPFNYENRNFSLGWGEGYPGLMIKCLDNRPFINISNHLYLVQEITYDSNAVTIVDADIEGQDCPQPQRNFSLSDSTPYLRYEDFYNAIFFYNCTNNNHNYSVAQLLPCLDNYNNSNTNERSYAFNQDSIPKGFDGYRTCSESVVAPYFPRGLTFSQFYKLGFDLSWSTPTECQDCEKSGGMCLYNTTTSVPRCGKEDMVCVQRKASHGRLVAVKVLNESKGNGEDFVNEVATIGGTNHVNVVNLLGFCAEKTKRALVYEFMPNGSLERFIYHEKESSTMPILGWEKLYQIALGIARGLEYLHRGCNTRILHFDIKPHNILLDQDLCPKISDFGMAKLCPTRDISVVSMVGARGTIGYIAPEVCCRNFGGVSHKSDVYSYGMMVLEMIGGRKNIDVAVENMSEIYFPSGYIVILNQISMWKVRVRYLKRKQPKG